MKIRVNERTRIVLLSRPRSVAHLQQPPFPHHPHPFRRITHSHLQEEIRAQIKDGWVQFSLDSSRFCEEGFYVLWREQTGDSVHASAYVVNTYFGALENGG